MPNAARAVASGVRPPAAPGTAVGMENESPPANSRAEIAQAGSSCKSASANSVTTTNIETSTIAARSISP